VQLAAGSTGALVRFIKTSDRLETIDKAITSNQLLDEEVVIWEIGRVTRNASCGLKPWLLSMTCTTGAAESFLKLCKRRFHVHPGYSRQRCFRLCVLVWSRYRNLASLGFPDYGPGKIKIKYNRYRALKFDFFCISDRLLASEIRPEHLSEDQCTIGFRGSGFVLINREGDTPALARRRQSLQCPRCCAERMRIDSSCLQIGYTEIESIYLVQDRLRVTIDFEGKTTAMAPHSASLF